MNTNELIDRLNTLQAQNIALMQIVAAILNRTGLDIEAEYRMRCTLVRHVTEPRMDADAITIQRETLNKVGRTAGVTK